MEGEKNNTCYFLQFAAPSDVEVIEAYCWKDLRGKKADVWLPEQEPYGALIWTYFHEGHFLFMFNIGTLEK